MFTKAFFLLACCSLPLISAAQSSTNQSAARPRQELTIRPHFRGDLKAYIAENLKYPIKSLEKETEGNCVVQFMVDEKGKVTRVAALKSSGDRLLDAEAERVVASMPDWRIAVNSMPHRHYFNLPINFELR